MSNPIIPVYLNQRMVFDLLAMLQDGLSRVAKVTTSEADKETISRDIGTTFGVANALSTLLKIDLSAKRNTSVESGDHVERTEERVHTPASLLFKLRQMLIDGQQLFVDSPADMVTPRRMIEFTSTLRRNPVIEVMDTLVSMINLLQDLGLEAQITQPQPTSKNKPKQQSSGDKIISQMRAFRESLVSGSTVDIVTDRMESGLAAVLTLETEFLSDPSMSNLVEGEFVVLGKVIRNVPQGESVNLLRKTPMSTLPDQVLQNGFEHFNTLSSVQGFSLPTVEWRIGGPAVHILPVAIYA